jgi:hypothetical protein
MAALCLTRDWVLSTLRAQTQDAVRFDHTRATSHGGPYLKANRTGRRIGGGGGSELTIESGAAELEQALGTAAITHLLGLSRNGKCRLSLINDDGT